MPPVGSHAEIPERYGHTWSELRTSPRPWCPGVAVASASDTAAKSRKIGFRLRTQTAWQPQSLRHRREKHRMSGSYRAAAADCNRWLRHWLRWPAREMATIPSTDRKSTRLNSSHL